ncbi:MAG: hypothetical protein U1F49_20155 [Rubrivivax sp.]
MLTRAESCTPARTLTALPRQFDRGWLQIYRRNVGPLAQGAVLVQAPK